MNEYENRMYEAYIKAEEEKEKGIRLYVNIQNVQKEKAEKIICEIEALKERMENILAE